MSHPNSGPQNLVSSQAAVRHAGLSSTIIAPGLRVVRLQRRLEEFFITATPNNNSDVQSMLAAIHRVIHETDATIVAMDAFGIPLEGLAAMRNEWGQLDWPVTWLNEDSGTGATLMGMQMHAIKGVAVERIVMNGQVVGSVFDDGFARHCHLGNLHPQNNTASPEKQARETFELLETTLHSVGMNFANVVRTWFYLDRILSWYDSFNRVRNQYFRERKVFDGLVPASTGIGSTNATRAALIANAQALQPHGNEVKVRAVPSPLQCSSLEYGSSFSRAVEVEMSDYRQLWISGTASVAPDGKTVHAGDLAGQIDRTMKVVAAILESRQMSWNDVTRAVTYLKDGNHAGLFREFCAANGLSDLPTVITESAICRDDLLFEIELDAMHCLPTSAI